ncbi:hypothetical protein BD779DRAFT_1613089 [Infundibulicybe gibba]|nr:hypothetical protein BD779DRAFT_1613089 [Infundibulicybe gibba]
MADVHHLIPAVSVDDELGIVYLIENAQQFWSELEDVLALPKDDIPTLSLLDSTLRRSLTLCSAYHEQYLQSPLQLDHACDLILQSELFEFHSERMTDIMTDELQSSTDPHTQLIFYHVLLGYGRRRGDFFRSHKRWQPLLPLLMDHVLVEIDSDVEDTYFGMAPTAGSSSGNPVAVPVPIEAKLRSLGVRVLYEVCRVQKLSVQDLRIFGDSFIDYLFDLVEQTRNMHDETFNYSVIKLIVALNEQFMVASLIAGSTAEASESKNRVLRVLMRRLGSSQTFGENMIFMLNRAQGTPEDLCMQLLVLKILYVLFTTPGTSEYFYTNDLCVLVDVFLRELVDLDEDSDSLRHTYLRVLHPLLTRTQLRDIPYKRPQVVSTLESLTNHSRIRDVSPTTKRLVDRCLSGDWCVQLLKNAEKTPPKKVGSESEAGSDSSAGKTQSHLGFTTPASQQLERSASGKYRALKSSKSVEHLTTHSEPHRPPVRPPIESARRPSNASTISLVGATTPANLPAPPKRRGTADLTDPAPSIHSEPHSPTVNTHPPRPHSATESDLVSNHIPKPFATAQDLPLRRKPPPAPPKRRKPPAVPLGRTNGGATITAIRSSATSPLSKVTKIAS